MRPIFSHTLIIVSIFAIVYIGFSYSNLQQIIKEQAASIYQTNIDSPKYVETYVSLMDIVTASLERIRDAAAVVSPDSTKEVSQIETASSTVSTDLADAIVNILCVYETKDYRRTVSGSGFMISKQGVILTNAHVAQFLLLKDSPAVKNTSCTVRINNETSDVFSAGLLYVSPTWILEYADMINSQSPRGSGENDFALLYLSDQSDEERAAATFPFIPVSTDSLSEEVRGQTVILVGYPASKEVSAKEGYSRKIATTTIANVYTFGKGSADVLSLNESILGYSGASGGPVIDHLGRAIGVISTKDEGTTMLNAITTAYIDAQMREETGFDLHSTIQGDLPSRAKLFNETVSPILGEIINQSLD